MQRIYARTYKWVSSLRTVELRVTVKPTQFRYWKEKEEHINIEDVQINQKEVKGRILFVEKQK
jgi:hypothetical protein